jgi:hypothetical protein
MARDYYQTGVVLRRKYALLLGAYAFSVAGVILIVAATVVFLLAA